MKTKQCITCRKVKLIKNFRSSKRKYPGCYARRCSDCKRIMHLKSRKRLLAAYSNGKCRCACCGERHLEFLCLDHIGGQETRKELGHPLRGDHTNLGHKLRMKGYPHKDRLRVLCANCNMATKYGRMCPHQRRKYEKAI